MLASTVRPWKILKTILPSRICIIALAIQEYIAHCTWDWPGVGSYGCWCNKEYKWLLLPRNFSRYQLSIENYPGRTENVHRKLASGQEQYFMIFFLLYILTCTRLLALCIHIGDDMRHLTQLLATEFNDLSFWHLTCVLYNRWCAQSAETI